MESIGIFTAITIVSSLLFSLVFYIFNRMGMFKSIQKQIDSLSDKSKHNLKLTSIILIIIIIPSILGVYNVSRILNSLILGVMIAFINICFRENAVEKIAN